MSNDSFEGFLRPDGTVGVRNYVLLLSADFYSNLTVSWAANYLHGTRYMLSPVQEPIPGYDREIVERFLVNIGRHPNVAATVVLGLGPKTGFSDQGLWPIQLAEKIAASGRPVQLVTVEEEGGIHQAIGRAVEAARAMVIEASSIRRQRFGLGDLTLGVKCGISDPFSAVAGNPVVGYLFDRLVDAGGTALFDEKTEVIGAEHIVAQRFTDPATVKRFLSLVREEEEAAKSTGEDVRATNPNPVNKEQGISTLEEKSLGAIAKSGTRPIQGIVAYGERPPGKGLWFMDGWPASASLIPGLAAAGAVIPIFQMGGGSWPSDNPPFPQISSSAVAPVFYSTGNPRAHKRLESNFDFGCGTVVEGKESLDEAGERLISKILSVASGECTKMETLRFAQPALMPYRGPLL